MSVYICLSDCASLIYGFIKTKEVSNALETCNSPETKIKQKKKINKKITKQDFVL